MEKYIRWLVSWPSFVLATSWLLAFVVYSLIFSAPSSEVFILFLIYLSLFFLGDMLGRNVNFSISVSLLPREVFIRIASVILIAIVVCYTYFMTKIILGYPSIGSGLLAIRYSNLDGEPVISHYNIYVNAIQVLLAFGVLGICISISRVMPKRIVLFYFFCTGLAAIASLLDGSRSFFVMGVLWVVAALYWLGVISIKRLISAVVVLVMIFAVTFSMFRPVDGGILTGLTYASLYFSGGIGAFGVVFDKSPEEIGIYWQSLELLTNKLAYLGLPVEEYKIYNLRNDFVYISPEFKTNVFTSLGLYFWYFGYGLFFMAVLIGFLGGVTMRASGRSHFGMWLYPLYLCALVMSLFHDYYLPYGYYILKVVICLVLLKLLSMPLLLRGQSNLGIER